MMFHLPMMYFVTQMTPMGTASYRLSIKMIIWTYFD